MEVSKSEEAMPQSYNFIVVGGGIAGVTCVETVSYFIENLRYLKKVFFQKIEILLSSV